MLSQTSSSFADSKAHYPILDGLRGVAAMVVVWYHVFEGYATSHLDQIINHGYLAVDFFFLLSGFVIAYAYDDRWHRMTLREFFKRRAIRLHPMVLFGALLGGALFYTQGCDWWDVSKVTVGSLLLGVVMNMFLIPAPVGVEVRGIGEMFPLNGPSWSLFFEYIGNLMYGLFVRRFSLGVLASTVAVCGLALGGGAIWGGQGDVGYGWTLMSWQQFYMGMLRMMFSFFMGLLMFRVVRPGRVRGAFWWCSALLVVLLVMPRVGGADSLWANGVYDMLCVALCFPLVVYMGVSGRADGPFTKRLVKFLGDISYPLYIVHYPFIYLYIAWVKNHQLPFSQSWYMALALFAGTILLAWVVLKIYDMPVRRWLSRKRK